MRGALKIQGDCHHRNMTDAILVIGGGIAGINCAMNAAKYGAKVYLAGDTPSIGGMMARFDKTFPTNDCSIRIEAPQMYEVDNHERIEILTNAEIRRVQAGAGVFKIRLLQKPRWKQKGRHAVAGHPEHRHRSKEHPGRHRHPPRAAGWRAEAPALPLSERRVGFGEIELGCEEPLMLAEARRCLQCDLEICLAHGKRQAGMSVNPSSQK